MSRYANLISGLLHLQEGVRGLRVFVILTLLLTMLPIAITPSGKTYPNNMIEAIATVIGLALPLFYLLLILMASGELIRIGYSLRDAGIIELVVSRGVRLSEVFVSLWISSSLRYLLFIAVGGVAADLSSYIIGALSPQEAMVFILGLALSVGLISAICILFSLFMSPGEAQYWLEIILFSVLGWIYHGLLVDPSRANFGRAREFVHVLLYGFIDPAVLAGEALGIVILMVIAAEISEELTPLGSG